MESSEKDNSFDVLLSRLQEAHEREMGTLLLKIKMLEDSEEPSNADRAGRVGDAAVSAPAPPEQNPPSLFADPAALVSATEKVQPFPTHSQLLAGTQDVQRQSESGYVSGSSSALNATTHGPRASKRDPIKRFAHMTPEHLRKQFSGLSAPGHIVKAPHGAALKILEVFVAIAIVLNTIFVGIEVGLKSDETSSACDSSGLLKALDAANVFFFFLFLVDLLVRVYLEKGDFLRSAAWRWNLFDCVVVLTMLLDQLSPSCNAPSEIRSPAVLRTFRLVRVFRVFKVIRGLRQLREFNVVLEALTRSFFTLACCAMPIATMIYICAIILTNSNSRYCNEEDNLDLILCEYFGSLGRSVVSLYAVTLGGVSWYQVLHVLWASSVLDFLIFSIYVTVSLLIVLNTITVMLIMKEQRFAKDRLKLTMKEDEEREQAQLVELLKRVFDDLDTNDNQGISRFEYTTALEDPKHHPDVKAWLSFMDMGGTKPDVLFDLIDTNGDGELSLKEFAAGCFWLKGTAKNIDSVKILNHIAELQLRLSELTGSHEEEAEIQLPNDQRVEHTASQFLSETSTRCSRLHSVPIGHSSMQPRGIRAAEDRAMTLMELRQLKATISAGCTRNSWVDQRTRSILRPEMVNLYSLCYNLIAPVTVPDGVVLKGLRQGRYDQGKRVVQADKIGGWVNAEGFLMAVFSDGSLEVKVTRGQFVPNGGSVKVADDDADIGVPSEVDAKRSWSYKEVISNTPTKPKWYCCHWWGEPVMLFVKLCETHAWHYGLKPALASFWICGYANNQHTLSDEIGRSPEKSSFRQAMLAAQGALLVLDPTAEAFSRIWCDYELYATICDNDRKLDIITAAEHDEPALISEELLPKERLNEKTHREQQFPVQLLAKGLQARLEDGKASVQEDIDMILQAIEDDGRKDGGAEEGARERALAHANTLLNSYIALRAWPVAVKHGIVHDFDATRPGTISLVDVLKHDTFRTEVTLSLAHSKATDEDVHAVGLALPEQLTYLHLSFEDCLISDVAACSLVADLPKKLQELTLDFSECTSITDATLACLAEHTPQKVENLHLCFANCGDGITENGVQVLALSLQRLPKLKALYANFFGTALNAEYKSLQKFKAILKSGFLKMLPGQLDIDNM